MPQKLVSLRLPGDLLSSFTELPTSLKTKRKAKAEEGVGMTPNGLEVEKKKKAKPANSGPKTVFKKIAASSPAPESPAGSEVSRTAAGRVNLAASANGGLLELDRSGRPSERWVPFQKEIKSFSGYSTFLTTWKRAKLLYRDDSTGTTMEPKSDDMLQDVSMDLGLADEPEVKEELSEGKSLVEV
ncbi:unnamed protein product [Kuraishia capsulata CBS 1993]|uniref:Uncharacterized protein n=1 Tax=Kuraishia capsulata CBS 1993 TaxID=1382522 RepID=W6MLL4_9ASCO|nr:uncharacterized protein KUCA_T00003364001 [Kuraishia capsulata CBS 1993]CDK27386.1 unnamed protein product [Kuraishia capsulata CBS 1993]